jgi:hypothetical protein
MTGRAFYPVFMRHAHSESPSICMGVTQGDSPKSHGNEMQLRRRSNANKCKAFCRLQHGGCPEIPHILLRMLVPKRHRFSPQIQPTDSAHRFSMDS